MLLLPKWMPNSSTLPHSRHFELGQGSRQAFSSRLQQQRGCHRRQPLAPRYGLRRSAPTRTLISRLSWRISGRLQTTSTNASRQRTRSLRRPTRMTTMTRTRSSTSSGRSTAPTSNWRTSPSSSPPLCHFPIRMRSCPSWGGNVRCRLPTCCRLLSRLPSRHKRRHAD